MAHEEEQEQYESDCHDHKKAWHLWQIRANGTEQWVDLTGPPAWDEDFEYRRIEPQFQPECFSGLNWRDAEKLVGKVVEFSQDGTVWTDCGKLLEIFKHERRTCRYRREGYLDYFIYIRTTPQTHAHPTITIGDKELPRPEVEAPKYNQQYFTFDCNEQNRIFTHIWCNDQYDKRWLRHRIIHLTESRAQAWASWWDETVVKETNRD